MVKFSLEEPYMIALGEDGYCVDFDRETYSCNIRDQRPSICRVFNCLRIPGWWQHFRKGIPGPKLSSRLEKVRQLTAEQASETAISSVQTAARIELDTTAYHVFQYESDRLLYDLGTGNIMRVDAVVYNILRDGDPSHRGGKIHLENRSYAC